MEVENRTGAGATQGPALVANSPPDGCTLLLNTSAQAYSAALSDRLHLPYDPRKDFIPIAALTSQPYVLVAGKTAGVETVAELIAMARANPGKLGFASTGPGTGTHLGALKFNLASGIRAIEIPPDAGAGIAEVLTGTIEGRTTYMLAPISAVTLPHIRNGDLMALGVSTRHRSSMLLNVPTIAEAGVAGYEFPIWYGVWVPEGTPPETVRKLHADLVLVMSGPELGDWLSQHGATRMDMTQSEFAKFVTDEARAASRLLESDPLRA